jgi:hypothetical protein
LRKPAAAQPLLPVVTNRRLLQPPKARDITKAGITRKARSPTLAQVPAQPTRNNFEVVPVIKRPFVAALFLRDAQVALAILRQDIHLLVKIRGLYDKSPKKEEQFVLTIAP